MSRAVALSLLVLAGCRTLLGIEEGVVAETTDGGADAASDGSPDAACPGTSCACRQNADCASNACISGAFCADAADVAYVSQNGNAGTCSMAQPCRTLVDGLASGKPYVKIAGHITNPSTATITSARVILGDDHVSSTITNAEQGPVIEVRDATSLEIRDVGIHGAGEGNDAHGILMANAPTGRLDVIGCRVYQNEEGGIVTQGGMVTIDRSVIVDNQQVGVAIDGAFIITNSIIVSNGNTMGSGGVLLAPAVGSTFEFNTVYNNRSQAIAGRYIAINCGTNLTIQNNIVQGITMGCVSRGSLLDQVDGEQSNFTGAPQFVQTTSMTNAGYYRIGPASAAIDRGTDTGVMVDIDNQARPATALDVGADEYVP